MQLIPDNSPAWIATAPDSPPMRVTVLACVAARCDECGLPAYRCRTEGGQDCLLCTSALRLPN